MVPWTPAAWFPPVYPAPARFGRIHELASSSEKTLRAPRRGVALAALGWFFAALALYWVGNWGHSLWDRDEPRYAVATYEMITGGDWIVPYFNGEYRFDKPILTYWLMSVPMRLLGVNEFSARAVSGVAGASTVLLVFLLALWMGADRSGAHVAALTALTCPLLLVVSKAATTDAVLVLTVVGAIALHWEQRRRGFSWIRHVAFWAVIGVSVLDKGPPGPLVVFLAVVGERFWWWKFPGGGDFFSDPPIVETNRSGGVWPRKPATSPGAVRSLVRTLIGFAVFFAVTLPWTWAAWVATDGLFFKVAIGFHVIDRAAFSIDSHSGPIVYYVPVILGATFPLTAVALVAVRWGWSERRRAPLRLLWCWLVPPFIVFSIVATKLPHYIAPLLPSLALMSGLWWTQWHANRGASSEAEPRGRPGDTPSGAASGHGFPRSGWFRSGAILTSLLGICAGVSLPIAALLAPFPRLLAPAIVLAALLAVSSLAGSVLWWRWRFTGALRVWATGFFAAALVGLLWGLPSLEPLRPSKQVVHWIRRHAPRDTELIAVGYQEPSLVFYWKGYVHMLGRKEDKKGLAQLSQLNRPIALVTTESRWQQWLDFYHGVLPPQVGVRFEKKFFHFQKGRWVRLVIVGNWPLEPKKPPVDEQNPRS